MSNSFPQAPFAPPEGRLPFSGIATFAGYPLWRAGKRMDAVVLGVPYDEGTTYRPGTRFGPRAVRDASMFYSYDGQADRFYDADRGRWFLQDKGIADAGDVAIEPLSLQKNWDAITEAVTSILSVKALPAIIGGDHSITWPVIKAFEGQSFHYIHLDTHADCDRMFDSQSTHGSPVLHILNEKKAQSITIIGVRGLTNSGHDIAWAQEQGVSIVTARELRQSTQQMLDQRLPEGDFYLSLDIDFFDPAAAPGTGTPEPGGLFFHEFSDLVQRIAKRGTIIGFDVVEVNPLLDGQSDVTSHLGARCMLELLGAALDDSTG